MDIVKVILTSILSVTALFALTKIMGNRQMSQLSMFDYINGITIGSIAAELATSLENDFWLPLTAMVVYAAATVLITFISTKSLKARRFLTGKSTILFENGEFRKADMQRAQIDVSEFMTQCRIYGCFSLSELETAILEPNGRISFLLKSDYRPAQPSDHGITPPAEKVQPTVILDGNILDGNLRCSGRDENWINSELTRLKCSLREILLGEIGNDGQLYVYRANEKKERRDIFQ
jgi:uncharacterized membrane protein YcaP (DUF421 family)